GLFDPRHASDFRLGRTVFQAHAQRGSNIGKFHRSSRADCKWAGREGLFAKHWHLANIGGHPLTRPATGPNHSAHGATLQCGAGLQYALMESRSILRTITFL